MPQVETCVPCGRGPDECAGTAEPEEDGPVTYWACTTCGFESGHQTAGTPDPGGCQLGIPEPVRRRASRPGPSRPVFLGVPATRRPS